MRFLAPLRSCDRFSVDVRVGKVSGARMTLQQQIVRLPRGADEPPQVRHVVRNRMQTLHAA